MRNFFYKEYFFTSCVFFLKQNHILGYHEDLLDLLQLRRLSLVIFFITKVISTPLISIYFNIRCLVSKLKLIFNVETLKIINYFLLIIYIILYLPKLLFQVLHFQVFLF
jgi:hypothetical protein